MSFRGTKLAKDLFRSRFWVNQLDSTYISHMDRLNEGKAYMLPDRLWKESRYDKSKMAASDFKRMRTFSAPGQELRFKKKHDVRRRNRAQVSFFCRYVMTQKNGTRMNLE